MIIFVYNKDGIIVTDRVPNGIPATVAYYQKFIHSVLCHKFENFDLKKLAAVCQYS